MEEDDMRYLIRAVMRCLAALTLTVSFVAAAQAPITLHGAVQFADGHAFNRALEKFRS